MTDEEFICFIKKYYTYLINIRTSQSEIYALQLDTDHCLCNMLLQSLRSRKSSREYVPSQNEEWS